jgi:ribA/ribD-fused uncharacterized protein
MNTINGFQGAFRFLSNFWPCYLVYENITYPTTEHAYQAAKIENSDIKLLIRDCPTPAEAKDYFETNKITPSPGWTIEKKLSVMKKLVTLKFGGQDPFLTRTLLETGNTILIEDNTWNDQFWGVCNGIGDNHLGKLLMEIRAQLFREQEQILNLLAMAKSNEIIADTLKITRRQLYEKMIAFKTPNKEFWIS